MSFDYPSHYQLRVDHIGHEVSRLPRNATAPLVLLGDSHFEMNPARELAGYLVVNMGIKGDEIVHNTGGIMRRLWLLPLARPSHVIILAGLNDLSNAKTPLDIEQNFKELIAAVKKSIPGTPIHIASVPPTRDRFAKYMHDIAVLNVILEELCEHKHVQFVDLFSVLEDDDGALAQNYTDDGSHLNDTGYDIFNEALEKHLKSGDSY